MLATAVLTSGGSSSPTRDGGAGETAVALTPYTVSATTGDAPLVTVDGLELTYLPPGVPPEPAIETGTTGVGEAETLACFGNPRCTGGGFGVLVTRHPGLDLDGYLETHFVANPTSTTVGGQPALATGVQSDEAAGLVWSPQPGVVIEINVDSAMAAELRRIVDGARFTG